MAGTTNNKAEEKNVKVTNLQTGKSYKVTESGAALIKANSLTAGLFKTESKVDLPELSGKIQKGSTAPSNGDEATA